MVLLHYWTYRYPEEADEEEESIPFHHPDEACNHILGAWHREEASDLDDAAAVAPT
jgi:hypothetical protein